MLALLLLVHDGLVLRCQDFLRGRQFLCHRFLSTFDSVIFKVMLVYQIQLWMLVYTIAHRKASLNRFCVVDLQ